MGIEDMDPSLLQDFLTESNELIEKLDVDLVTLESIGEGPEQKDLLDGIFRALHTIKGAASFLGLTTLIDFAHIAEDTLNRLRKGEVSVTAEVMDAMLRSVDVLREMLVEVDGGQAITPAPPELFDQLKAIVASEEDTQTTSSDQENAQAKPATPSYSNGTPLPLPPEKTDLLEFMVSDLTEATEKIGECIDEAINAATRTDAANHLGELAENITKTAQFFDLKDLTSLAKLLQNIAGSLSDLSDTLIPEVLVRVRAVKLLIDQQAEALGHSMALSWPLETFHGRVTTLIGGNALEDGIAGQHGDDPVKVLELDGVLEPGVELRLTADTSSESQPGSEANEPSSQSTPADQARAVAKKTGDAPAGRASVGEQTIRVEVSRLESLLNLVGRLVLNKNRLMSLSRRLREHDLPHEEKEQFAVASSDLDQLTSELQMGVMRTRMQPLAKLFDRYPRVIRDMARMTEKKINLEIVGKETEVDKSVLEVLADPLVHILRNSADHGVEQPETRVEQNKSETGTIRLTAEHQGSHVRVEITDDGKGLDRKVIGDKALERGLVTPEQLSTLSDEEVFRFIFAAGFSTAEKVTDLSGRGVGMDVVRTNIAKINGTINISAKKGEGTTIEILIPLTVAIMPAMMVGIGKHLYAVPLTTIIEIVRPEDDMVHTVGGQPVMRLRNTVLPLLDMQEKLQETESEGRTKFAVVVGVGQQRAGLVVDRLIGQQEIVIKPLDDRYTSGGPFSGATIREDGDVSLILDVIQLIRQAQIADRAAA